MPATRSLKYAEPVIPNSVIPQPVFVTTEKGRKWVEAVETLITSNAAVNFEGVKHSEGEIPDGNQEKVEPVVHKE